MAVFWLAWLLHAQDCPVESMASGRPSLECYKDVPKKLTAHLKLAGWPKDTVLRKSASDSGEIVAKLGKSEHWSDEEIEFTGKFSGEWAEVELHKFEAKPESCEEDPLIKWKKTGWMRAKEKAGKVLVWSWLYTGLC